ncbi:AroM family protein [Aquibacillus albus]|uniref:Protein AroM n=1 Tax=Aquibacillus albus TaxID=1168171 RepID=A0ABS2N5N8_9BACI|nr:AroM family protein [Aquibacillus albus]MBM7573445.1 protein AroM [Aquibacillus albus]
MRKVGLVTIGQSPRVDMTPEMKPLLGEDTSFIEAGALDDLSEAEIARLAPRFGEFTYVSRLRNGSSVKLSKEKLLPYVQNKILDVEKSVSSSIVVCTGSFPTIIHSKPILFPDLILYHVVQSVIGNGKLGIIVPLEEQIGQLTKKWGDIPIVVSAASPYEKVDIESPSNYLKEKGATLFVLDCMGYTEEHKHRVKKTTNLPALLPRSLVARVATELA